MFYVIDYQKDNWYNKIHATEFGAKLDRLLSFYNYICFLRLENIISKKEFGFVEYHVVRILSNESVKTYLFYICHFSFTVLNPKKLRTSNGETEEILYERGNKNFSFRYLLEYGVKNGIIESDIYDREYVKYHKYLDF